MTDEKLSGLKEYNSSLNHLVKESLEEALVSLMKVKDFNQITISELCKMKERILVYLLFIASIIGIIQWLFLNVNSLLQYNHSV